MGKVKEEEDGVLMMMRPKGKRQTRQGWQEREVGGKTQEGE